ncbi:MAG: hypothetical protein ACTSYI_16855 [Promethearchaeota archaeon]
MNTNSAGYWSSISQFMSVSPDEILSSLANLPSNRRRVEAWAHTIEALKDVFNQTAKINPEILTGWIFFEYDLPLSGGRRPDVILLTKSHIIVIEVKDQDNNQRAHVDQVKAYVRDIQSYHEKSHQMQVDGILWMVKREVLKEQLDNIHILGTEPLS